MEAPIAAAAQEEASRISALRENCERKGKNSYYYAHERQAVCLSLACIVRRCKLTSFYLAMLHIYRVINGPQVTAQFELSLRSIC
jgi:hypothetical protein